MLYDIANIYTIIFRDNIHLPVKGFKTKASNGTTNNEPYMI